MIVRYYGNGTTSRPDFKPAVWVAKLLDSSARKSRGHISRSEAQPDDEAHSAPIVRAVTASVHGGTDAYAKIYVGVHLNVDPNFEPL